MSSKEASKVYQKYLSSKIQGYSIFTPEPDENLPPEHWREGIRIADVVRFLPDGSLDVLFNAGLPPDHVINHRGVPKGFEPVSWAPEDVSKRPYHSKGTVITGGNIKRTSINFGGSTSQNVSPLMGASVGFEFECSSDEGAILVLPEGSTREDLLSVKPLHTYALKNASIWYAYVDARGRMLRDRESLFVVTGCDKTRCWGIAAFSGSSSSGGMSLTFTTLPIASASASVSYQWITPSCATVRVSQSHLSNQCVYIRGFFVRRPSRVDKLAAAIRGSTSCSLPNIERTYHKTPLETRRDAPLPPPPPLIHRTNGQPVSGDQPLVYS